jgi:[acyl-carrier-protein] S-malonyltransferase
MLSAIAPLAEAAAGLTPSDPSLPLWTNSDGSRIASGARYLELLVSQVANPVRWDACLESFSQAGITGLIELAPAGALVGIAKRALKGVPTVAVKTPADLDAAVELISEAS